MLTNLCLPSNPCEIARSLSLFCAFGVSNGFAAVLLFYFALDLLLCSLSSHVLPDGGGFSKKERFLLRVCVWFF